MRRYIAFIIILIASCKSLAADGNSANFNLSGDVKLLSHYVENGLSQSDRSPSLQGSFWFNFGPQFRLGIWGSNTNYEGSDDHFNLRINADIKVDLSQDAHLRIAYSESQFYKVGDRNGNILGVHLNFWDYRILYDKNSNWEGTKRRSNRYAFGHTYSFSDNWKWNNEIGYNTVDRNSIKAYFDGRTGIGKRMGVIFLEGALTATSESSQFENGVGDVFFILSASTEL